MKIKGTCTNCAREFLAEQVIAAHGHCPWCGNAITRDYTAVLVNSLRQAEAAGAALQDALEEISELDLHMTIDEESVLEPLTTALRSARRRVRR